ncbi:MAG TPA: ATP-dependent DNA helicase RecG [Thiotrichaceae bacterium]|nr:ATP-dependent DNA helicase RecG [Thiotrichaceae bacterium]HIM08644.1 ATP-dependent DNA helicase RecG [Gammaproteobacteria bacterium]
MTLNNQHSLSAPVTVLSGVGPRLQEKLERISIAKIQDLLFHLPYRYIDRTRISPIGTLRPGHDAYIQGEIELTQVRFGKRRSLLCRISDGSGTVVLRFFYFSKSQEKGLQRGLSIRCYGQVRHGQGSLEIVHPEYRVLKEHQNDELDEKLTAVYPSTEGLQQARLRKLTEQALLTLSHDKQSLVELLPEDILTKLHLPTLADALAYVHRPPPDADIQSLVEGKHASQQRLAFEELLAHQLSLLELRKEFRAEQSPAFNKSIRLVPEFLKALAFKLTNAQQRAYKTIASDLNKTEAMLRLLQGDVGSGKTVVAAMAALQAIEAGYQVAIMAPTELLSAQHYNNFLHWFEPLNIDVVFLTGKLKKSLRAEAEARLQEKTPVIAIGTHALFQDSVYFANLGLIVIDEQHRFGVHQRLSLLEKGKLDNLYPHQLIMTATPIPRTLTMTAYADLDHTVIDELPPGRKAISTSIISNERRDDIIDRIKHICAEGRQVYWVCTLIEESETLQCETAIETAETLKEKLSPINVGLIHGRMKSNEKETTMQDFKDGKIDLLVATTVIEVGVDVPNASLMIIDNAERFGLSQLHQLRGRIGRGEIKSDCVLMYQSPLSDLAKQRLDIMRVSNDGFDIAEKDLELRGPGEVLGTRQAGMPDMRVADLIRDAYLLPEIQNTAKILVEKNPDKVELLIHRWLGNNIEYSNV